VNTVRLILAVEGEEGNNVTSRLPLTFPTFQQFWSFRRDCADAVHLAGCDHPVVIQQVGSACRGWSSNIDKPCEPWRPSSDADFAVFSQDAILQMKGISQNKHIDGESDIYNIYKSSGPLGFYQRTALGKELQKVADKWNKILYGLVRIDGTDFKLNVGPAEDCFYCAIDVYRAVPRKVCYYGLRNSIDDYVHFHQPLKRLFTRCDCRRDGSVCLSCQTEEELDEALGSGDELDPDQDEWSWALKHQLPANAAAYMDKFYPDWPWGKYDLPLGVCHGLATYAEGPAAVAELPPEGIYL